MRSKAGDGKAVAAGSDTINDPAISLPSAGQFVHVVDRASEIHPFPDQKGAEKFWSRFEHNAGDLNFPPAAARGNDRSAETGGQLKWPDVTFCPFLSLFVPRF